MTDTSSLRAFIEARLDDDERAANKAARFPYDHPSDAPWERSRLAIERRAALSSDPHIARHDPARVLREVAAKRAILQAAAEYSPELEHGDNGEWALDLVLRLLAQPFADHPDYRTEWAS